MGISISLDWNSSWGYGSSSSIVKQLKNTDGTFSLVVKSTILMTRQAHQQIGLFIK